MTPHLVLDCGPAWAVARLALKAARQASAEDRRGVMDGFPPSFMRSCRRASADDRRGCLPSTPLAEDKTRTYASGMADQDPWHPTLTTPLGDCRDWCIRMTCSLCDGAGTYRLADMAGTLGRHHTVAQVVARLRCQQCPRAPVDVQLISTIDPHSPAQAIRIPV